MKKIIKEQELEEQIVKSIHILCDTVKHTLGPKGNNVLISGTECASFITNDGVTIARNIESEDPVCNAILDIAKESSLKTNDLVGDGTTTTLVLLESMIDLGIEELKKGANAQMIKKEMEEYVLEIINKLENNKQKTSEEDKKRIAISSSNEEELGTFIYDVYKLVNQKGAMKIEESTKEKSEYIIRKGYPLEHNYPIDLLKDINVLTNSYIMLIDGRVDSLEEISEVINAVIKEQKNIIIVASEIDELAKEETLSYNLEQSFKIIMLETPEYGTRKLEILKDLEALTNAKIWYKKLGKEYSLTMLGKVKKIEIENEYLLLENEETKHLKEYQKTLMKKIKESDSSYEKEFLENRFAKLSVGLAIIMVGGITKTSIREKKMRMEDAICALEASKEGVIEGSGYALLKIKEESHPKNIGAKIIYESLKAPFFQILENAGLNKNEIYETIKKEQFKVLYNVKKERYETIQETEVKDPVKVVITSLKNAVSIASMLFTTSHLVINEKEEIKDIEI